MSAIRIPGIMIGVDVVFVSPSGREFRCYTNIRDPYHFSANLSLLSPMQNQEGGIIFEHDLFYSVQTGFGGHPGDTAGSIRGVNQMEREASHSPLSNADDITSQWLKTGFGLVNRFIDHLQAVTTNKTLLLTFTPPSTPRYSLQSISTILHGFIT
jgi:hypothetical protein